MRGNSRSRLSGTRFLIGALLLAALLGGLLFRKYLNRQPMPNPVPVQSIPEQGVKSATLFFASPDGAGLVRESRLLEPCSGIEGCAEEVLVEIVNGPIGDLSPTLPETTMYHGISLAGDILTVDFGRELQEGMVSGSEAEIAAVYSVVNSLAINFPKVKSVRFLVEGKPMDSLKGHIDLREPLAPDFTLEKNIQPPANEPEPKRSKQ